MTYKTDLALYGDISELNKVVAEQREMIEECLAAMAILLSVADVDRIELGERGQVISAMTKAIELVK